MTDQFDLYRGDVYEWAQNYNGARFHACLCDPPYELGFMGKKWDSSGVSFQPETWAAISDCLLPGAFLLAFGGTRTWHRLAVAIEDAGFEIRDTIMWVYGSGFPKSHDVSKAIDRAAGEHQQELVPTKQGNTRSDRGITYATKTHAGFRDISTPSTPLAVTWQGYGTALKPAWEPVIVARKPLEGTVAENCVEYGAGALWIDGARVGMRTENESGWSISGSKASENRAMSGRNYAREAKDELCTGRWPANFCHDGSDEVVGLFPQANGGKYKAPNARHRKAHSLIPSDGMSNAPDNYGDSGSAARFFYCAKASKAERDAGCEGLEEKESTEMTGRQPGTAGLLRVREDGSIGENPYAGKSGQSHNHHPTVKPIALTEYLARLILPPAAYAPRRILVPFCGSGSEIIGALRAGWDYAAGIDISDEYTEIARLRIGALVPAIIQEALFEV